MPTSQVKQNSLVEQINNYNLIQCQIIVYALGGFYAGH